MKLSWKALLVACAAGTAAWAAAQSAELQKARLPEVLVIGDAVGVTKEFRPAPGRPVHFIIMGGKPRDFGDAVVEVKSPPSDEVRRELVHALQSQGFVETSVGGPMPELAIAFSWGTASLVSLEDEVDDLTRRDVRKVLGFEKADRRILAWWDADRMNFAYGNDRVYMFIFAYDAAALARKEWKLLWRTRVSLHWGDHQADSTAVMLASAAPFFGVDTDRGVFVDDRYRRANVQVGEATVVEEDVQREGERKPPTADAKDRK